MASDWLDRLPQDYHRWDPPRLARKVAKAMHEYGYQIQAGRTTKDLGVDVCAGKRLVRTLMRRINRGLPARH